MSRARHLLEPFLPGCQACLICIGDDREFSRFNFAIGLAMMLNMLVFAAINSYHLQLELHTRAQTRVERLQEAWSLCAQRNSMLARVLSCQPRGAGWSRNRTPRPFPAAVGGGTRRRLRQSHPSVNFASGKKCPLQGRRGQRLTKTRFSSRHPGMNGRRVLCRELDKRRRSIPSSWSRAPYPVSLLNFRLNQFSSERLLR